ncbi:relaxase/mobilization nuclease domain-containing protein [Arvimicrobium flavum]|uniref:relaxase/mobilization nuclease domain-containing protein n=1 Tax=Arvimicrobium flavum TaxID=3393320 RepID=UPI00237A0E55|nr:relaxase [Mesorhizobium shangrilense]
MILKGSQRTGATDLAAHLMNGVDNEDVSIAELRGTTAADLFGAFAEYEATAAGTRCKEPFYSLSINPPVRVDRAAYFAAIERIEQTLKLSGQPRAVIFHVKDGREHCHVVWSRIYADGDRLKSVHMSHDHAKLTDLSVQFFRELEVPLPFGLQAWAAKNPDRHTRPGQDYTRAEKIQSEATGMTVKERRQILTEAFRGSDTADAFRAALEAAGFTLAIGDKRAFVVLDDNAEIFSLARQIDGASSRDVKAKLTSLAGVPDVQKAKAILKERAAVRLARLHQQAETDAARLRAATDKRRRKHALMLLLARLKQELRNIEERLALKARHKAEFEHLMRLRDRPLRRMLRRLPAVAAIIRYYERQTDLDLLRRQREEAEALRRQQELRACRDDITDAYRRKLEQREDRAQAFRTMSRAMRMAAVANRAALAAGHMTPDDITDLVNPDRLNPREWYRHCRQNGHDITDQHTPAVKSNHDTRGHKRQAFTVNATDIVTRRESPNAARDTRAPQLSATHHSAVDLIRNAKLTMPRDAAPVEPPPSDPQDPSRPTKRPNS